MLSDPAGRAVVVRVATPAVTVPVPRDVTPSRKFTVPVGVPAAAVTVAVKVMLAPAVMLATGAVSAVVVAAGATGAEP
jgi:hypothetical protein